jgi:hypothetical protein
MTMKRLLMVLLLLSATSAFASDNSYRFRAAWTDDHFEFTDGDGTHWKWLKLGCPKNVECSIRINSHGGAGRPEQPADLLIARGDEHSLKVECLRESGCEMRIGSGDNQIVKTLAPGESIDAPSGDFVAFTASSGHS